MLRFLGGEQGFFANLHWVPRVPVLQSLVFASMFPQGEGEDGDAVWTFINRNREKNVTGAQIEISTTGDPASFAFYDCYHGAQLRPKAVRETDASGVTISKLALSFSIESGGIGCLLRLAPNSTLSQASLSGFLGRMAKLTTGKPLGSLSREWKGLQMKMIAHNATPATDSPPAGMVLAPPGSFHFALRGVGHEGSSVVQFPWEAAPTGTHNQAMKVSGAFGHGLYVDQYPVTCGEYAAYLKDSGYVPRDAYNWLKSWDHSASASDPASHVLPDRTAAGGEGVPVPPDGYANKPVTYVSFAEAQRYCKHYRKRLPEAFEFQYFATGGKSNYSFPWGETDDPSRYPQPGMIYLSNGSRINHNHYQDTIPGPADVDLFAGNGSSAFNVSDLMGNVWQYTSVFEDEHTAGVITQGSCNYDRDTFAPYYFTRAKSLLEHNKYFLFDDSWERCGTIGFRCVADAGPREGS